MTVEFKRQFVKVGFVGVGRLGKDASEVMAEHYDVTGYDINDVVTTIKLADTLEECCKDKDVVFIAVPTAHDPEYDGRYPSSHLEPKDFDYSVAVNVTAEVDKLVNKNTIIVMISTMLPGTVRREIAPLIHNGRFVYNPYLIAQGTVKYDMRNPEMIMIGTEDGSTTKESAWLSKFYEPMLEQETRIVQGTWEEMESTKIFYNTFITAKLCLVNMIQDTAMQVGHMNVDIVTDALKNSKMRIMGPSYMKAGLGDGGGCHPRDNIALRSLVERYDMTYDLFDAIMIAREKQAENIANFFTEIGAPKDRPVVILGSGFKPGIDYLDGSPSVLVGYYLEKLGYDVGDEKSPCDASPKNYLIGWNDYFIDYTFPPDSYIIDPWRQIPPNDEKKLRVFHYGNTRDGISCEQIPGGNYTLHRYGYDPKQQAFDF